MNFLFHGNDLSLTNGGVKSVLHFLLELDLALPKQHLSLILDNVGKDLSLLILEGADLVLEANAFVLKIAQLLLELLLSVHVLLLQLLTLVLVVVQQVVELAHFTVEVFLGNFKLSDLFLMHLHLVVEAQLLLLEDRLASDQLFAVVRQLHVQVLLHDEVSLVSDPLLLDLNDLLVDLVLLLLEVVPVSLHGTTVLIAAALLQLSNLTVESIDLELMHVKCLVARLDDSLKCLHLLLFVGELEHELLLLLLEQLVLLLAVEVIDHDTSDFV